MKKVPFLLFLPCFFAACKKDSGSTGDCQVPIIKLSTPYNTQAYKAGQLITVGGTVTDNQKVRDLQLEILNTATGAFITHEQLSPGAASYAFRKTFTAQTAATYKIKVEALDDKGNKALAEITVSAE